MSFPVATSCSTEDFVLAGRMFIMPKPFPLEFRLLPGFPAGSSVSHCKTRPSRCW
ncbi:MAG: hypothetical protein ACRDPY_03010 [Streptosporangiaceae bacterium]